MPVNTVEVHLDRPRQLLYNHNALADLDMVFLRDFGKSIFQVLAGLDQGIAVLGSVSDDDIAGIMKVLPPEIVSVAGMRIFLWAGLRHEDKTLTLEKMGNLMDQAAEHGMGLIELMTPVITAIQKSSVFKMKQEEPAQPAGKE